MYIKFGTDRMAGQVTIQLSPCARLRLPHVVRDDNVYLEGNLQNYQNTIQLYTVTFLGTG